MSIINKSSNFLKICSLLNVKKGFIVKFPSQALFINHLTAIYVTCPLLIIATVILNGVSVVTIFKCALLKEKISYFLIMMQSVADLTVGLISLPSFIIYCSFTIATTRSIHCTEILLLERLAALPTLLESLSSTSDTNNDTNNMSCACSLLARSTRTSVLEVTTTEVGLVLEVGRIVRQTHINRIFHNFYDKHVNYLFISIA
jgi:hypothetical protein